MRYLRHEYILLAAFLAAAAAFFSLRNSDFSIDAAVCACFTIVVFGNALRQRGRNLLFGDDARLLTEIIFAHTVCLTTLVMILRTGMFSSMLPDWLNVQLVADHYERMGPTAFQMLQAASIFTLGYLEVQILVAPRKRNFEKEEKRANAARWRNAELDAERMDGLRLQ